jgi:LacI family transcriptional regulator
MATMGAAPIVLEAAHFTLEGGREVADRLLESGRPVSAIIAANDLMAIGTMQSLAAHGLSVPGDVSVAGFDDILAAALVTPALTTVAQFQDRIGARAAEKLIERLADGTSEPGQAEEMPYELIIRASVAPFKGQPEHMHQTREEIE